MKYQNGVGRLVHLGLLPAPCTNGKFSLIMPPKVLDEAILLFATPFLGEQGDDRGATGEERVAVPPLAVDRIGERDPRRDRGQILP